MIYVVSFSGGRDSAAVAVWFCKNPPADMTAAHFVFSDTGIEPRSVYDARLSDAEVRERQRLRDRGPGGAPP